MNALLCWLVRLFGGSHKYRKARKGEPSGTKTCQRCAHVATVKTRVAK